ncbi:probable serine/threonine-protein kinase dyrk2 [Dreissena polymorpha]|uniref:Uncharacterized protein n=1 Tax=Dreissena polymorpha TaxID=45954 RepID=A0A9D3Z0V3_DREPO|nr:probable serine/threonine-protein kinase dyrk2 [Dreissena polymorpha]KAH3709837.1 hypothetical protein DPMN_069302 [Dreissena polymorpha]
MESDPISSRRPLPVVNLESAMLYMGFIDGLANNAGNPETMSATPRPIPTATILAPTTTTRPVPTTTASAPTTTRVETQFRQFLPINDNMNALRQQLDSQERLLKQLIQSIPSTGQSNPAAISPIHPTSMSASPTIHAGRDNTRQLHVSSEDLRVASSSQQARLGKEPPRKVSLPGMQHDPVYEPVLEPHIAALRAAFDSAMYDSITLSSLNPHARNTGSRSAVANGITWLSESSRSSPQTRPGNRSNRGIPELQETIDQAVVQTPVETAGSFVVNSAISIPNVMSATLLSSEAVRLAYYKIIEELGQEKGQELIKNIALSRRKNALNRLENMGKELTDTGQQSVSQQSEVNSGFLAESLVQMFPETDPETSNQQQLGIGEATATLDNTLAVQRSLKDLSDTGSLTDIKERIRIIEGLLAAKNQLPQSQLNQEQLSTASTTTSTTTTPTPTTTSIHTTTTTLTTTTTRPTTTTSKPTTAAAFEEASESQALTTNADNMESIQNQLARLLYILKTQTQR